MSYGVFGESVYFPSDYGPTWTSAGTSTLLPYPPVEVWCALVVQVDGIADEGTRGSTYEILFVGLHMNLYNAAWMVHKGTPLGSTSQPDLSGGNLLDTLSTIGCDLGLSRVGPIGPGG